MAEVEQRIVLDPAILAGKPVVRGTRLSVEFVIGLMADGWSEADILANYPGLTRDAGRMFLGVDLQCCQCHNHLTVKSYKQADFNGLYVAFQNAKVAVPDATHKAAWVREGAIMAKYDFVSVLTGVKGQTGPRVPFGEEIATPEGDEAWLVKPDPKKKELGVPRVSPLKEIAARVGAERWRLTSSGSSARESGRTSTMTGIAPAVRTGITVRRGATAGTITSVPGPTPRGVQRRV